MTPRSVFRSGMSPGVVGARRLVRDEAGHQLARRELVVAVAIGGPALAVGRHPVEVQVRERHEALGLLVVERRVRVAAGQPAPRAVEVIGLPPVDDDVGDAAAEFLHHAPPAGPLRVAARAVDVQERVVERVAAEAEPVVEGDERLDQPVLQAAEAEIAVQPLRVALRARSATPGSARTPAPDRRRRAASSSSPAA